MRIEPFAAQLRRILVEYERNGSIFGIPRPLFHVPSPRPVYAVPSLFGRYLAAPFGPSAGPHTQLSGNIVAAWLCGGRFIELKTVQVLDHLEIPRPCIDMPDEGYNVEWSQELTLQESAHEYVAAWALLHVLPHILGWQENDGDARHVPGVIFDMSVGYDLEGLMHPRMVHFMDVMADASEQIEDIQRTLRAEFPGLAGIRIPTAIVNSVTVSTLHGCPPGEIGRIARHLLEERGLHTVVKLNPTLLGRDRVLEILHGSLGFTDIDVPAEAFDHDLQFDAAVGLASAAQAVAARRQLTFGVKLSNTLAVGNHAGRLPGNRMYMSGRALYPVTMALYERLAQAFEGTLHVSYSGGADALNAPTILSCGALPVTGCTDLLKPGGVGRLRHWLEHLEVAMSEGGAASLREWSRNGLSHLRAAAAAALTDPRYRKHSRRCGPSKVATPLPSWDCVVAPCVGACAIEQDVPGYAWMLAEGQDDQALAVILARNPLPGVTGHVCTRLCEAKCTRNDYERSVAIRALKRYAEEHGRAADVTCKMSTTGHRVAVVGSGPSGLAAAAFLALHGIAVTVFEQRDAPGGMMRLVPPFRLPQAVLERDIARIVSLGVQLRLNTRITDPPEDLLQHGFDAVYLASGFQRDAPLAIPGVAGPGVIPALRLLDASRRGHRVALGPRVVVVGGGDTAMDAARTARRMTGQPVTVLYRRTRREMPAAGEELDGALEEGCLLQELVSPLEVLRDQGRVVGLRCVRNTLEAPGPDARAVPVAVADSEFTLLCDTVVVAVGQLPELAFLDGSRVTRHASGGITVDADSRSAGPPGVYAGGDVVVEPGSIVSACADGRAAGEAVCRRLGVPVPAARGLQLPSDADILAVKELRTRRVAREEPRALPLSDRDDFSLIESTLTPRQVRIEARRCLQCSTICDKCVEVCPNRANCSFPVVPVRWLLPVLACRAGNVEVVATEEFVVRQPRQIVHLHDFCNECGNCQTFCVHHGRPWADKPRLFLDAALFAAASGVAFHLDGRSLRHRADGHECRLTRQDGGWLYEDSVVRVRVRHDWHPEEMTANSWFLGTRSLRTAADMAVLYDGVTTGLPFLLER